jgi:hypothetical protein
VKIGLIARADNTGLGVQTHEFYKHMDVAKTMVIDLSDYNQNEQHFDRYPDGKVVKGFPTPTDFSDFLKGLDIVFTCEIPYGYNLFDMARFMGVKTVLQYNFEFLDYLQSPHLPKPDLLVAPTLWRYDDVPFENKAVLPVPVATEHFTTRDLPEVASTFLHIVGKPAIHDRNGTYDLLKALQFVTSTIKVVIKCTQPDYVVSVIGGYAIPENVTIEIDTENKPDYWDNYNEGDVLVMPRRYGGLCLPVNEALGAGMPVIMPHIDPNDTWLNADWLVPATKTSEFMARTTIDVFTTDAQALAKKIDQFATDRSFYSRAKHLAYNYKHRQSWETLKPVYETVFDELITKGHVSL